MKAVSLGLAALALAGCATTQNAMNDLRRANAVSAAQAHCAERGQSAAISNANAPSGVVEFSCVPR